MFNQVSMITEQFEKLSLNSFKNYMKDFEFYESVSNISIHEIVFLKLIYLILGNYARSSST